MYWCWPNLTSPWPLVWRCVPVLYSLFLSSCSVTHCCLHIIRRLILARFDADVSVCCWKRSKFHSFWQQLNGRDQVPQHVNHSSRDPHLQKGQTASRSHDGFTTPSWTVSWNAAPQHKVPNLLRTVGLLKPCLDEPHSSPHSIWCSLMVQGYAAMRFDKVQAASDAIKEKNNANLEVWILLLLCFMCHRCNPCQQPI